jgi:hypothetical protein
LGLLESDVNTDVIAGRLNEDVAAVAVWAKRKNLVLAPNKSHITFFTPWTKEVRVHPQVLIDGQVIPLNRNPKWLGINFDPLWCFKNHSDELKKSSSQQVPMMKAVRNSSFGFDKETMILTYNTFIKPVFSFAPAIWVPNCKKSNIKQLQTVQNKALRCITGCHQATGEDHLHQETGILPVADRLDMLCAQFLASAMHQDHPSHETVLLPSGPRKMHIVEPFLQDGVIKEITYKKTLEAIHSSAVAATISRQGPNRVLQGPAPVISASE